MTVVPAFRSPERFGSAAVPTPVRGRDPGMSFDHILDGVAAEGDEGFRATFSPPVDLTAAASRAEIFDARGFFDHAAAVAFANLSVSSATSVVQHGRVESGSAALGDDPAAIPDAVSLLGFEAIEQNSSTAIAGPDENAPTIRSALPPAAREATVQPSTSPGVDGLQTVAAIRASARSRVAPANADSVRFKAGETGASYEEQVIVASAAGRLAVSARIESSPASERARLRDRIAAILSRYGYQPGEICVNGGVGPGSNDRSSD